MISKRYYVPLIKETENIVKKEGIRRSRFTKQPILCNTLQDAISIYAEKELDNFIVCEIKLGLFRRMKLEPISYILEDFEYDAYLYPEDIPVYCLRHILGIELEEDN